MLKAEAKAETMVSRPRSKFWKTLDRQMERQMDIVLADLREKEKMYKRQPQKQRSLMSKSTNIIKTRFQNSLGVCIRLKTGNILSHCLHRSNKRRSFLTIALFRCSSRSAEQLAGRRTISQCHSAELGPPRWRGH